MLTFLRKIRRTLIANNKITTYLLYAVGEILLVVIGIIIAIQIDEWRNELRNDKEEIEILKNFRSDILLDISDLDSLIVTNTRLIASKDTIYTMLVMHDREAFQKDFVRLQLTLQSWSAFKINSGTYDENVYAGKMPLVKDDKLRERIFSYYRKSLTVAQTDQTSRKVYEDHVYIKWAGIFYRHREWSGKEFGMPNNLPTLKEADFFDNHEYFSMLTLARKVHSVQRSNWSAFKEQSAKLLSNIDEEIARKSGL